MSDSDGLIHIQHQQALANKIEPLTFAKLPWVAGIDTLPDLEWMQSNPDGIALLAYLQSRAMFPDSITKIELFVRPLRAQVRSMLQDQPCADCDQTAQYGMIGNLEAFETWDEGDIKDFIKEVSPKLDRFRQVAPLTVDDFTAHMHVDAKYWIAKRNSEKADFEAERQGRTNH